MHGRQTRKGSMKVCPDPAQVAGSSADFHFESKERLGIIRKGWAAISVQTLSKKTTVLKAQIPEDLNFSETEGKNREGLACEQALSYLGEWSESRENAWASGEAERGRRKAPSLARSREAHFAYPNRRACAQARDGWAFLPIRLKLNQLWWEVYGARSESH